MASNSETVQVSSFPLPPMQYIDQYTDEMLKRGRAPKPPPPIHGQYTMFGNSFNTEEAIIRPLESQGIKRLYPLHFDRRRELKKLNFSLLANFLDLLDVLVRCPDSPRRGEKVEDLSLLFINIHHLLNEFRPHQARETLRVMMELQKRQRIETADRFKQLLDMVHEILQQAIQTLPEPLDLVSKLFVDTHTGAVAASGGDNGRLEGQLQVYLLDGVWLGEGEGCLWSIADDHYKIHSN